MQLYTAGHFSLACPFLINVESLHLHFRMPYFDKYLGDMLESIPRPTRHCLLLNRGKWVISYKQCTNARNVATCTVVGCVWLSLHLAACLLSSYLLFLKSVSRISCSLRQYLHIYIPTTTDETPFLLLPAPSSPHHHTKPSIFPLPLLPLPSRLPTSASYPGSARPLRIPSTSPPCR